MKEFPESEKIQANFFADAGEKFGGKFGEKIFLCPFSPFDFQEKWLQEISRKILHIFREGQNKILSQRDSGRGVPYREPFSEPFTANPLLRTLPQNTPPRTLLRVAC